MPVTPAFLWILRRFLHLNRAINHQQEAEFLPVKPQYPRSTLPGERTTKYAGAACFSGRSEYLMVGGHRYFYCFKTKNVFFSDALSSPVSAAMATTVTIGLHILTTKPITQNEAITYILRPDYITTCEAKVSALKAKPIVLSDKDIVLEISGYGLYSTAPLRIMKKWHQAMKIIKQVDKAISWIDAVDFSIPMTDSFKIGKKSDLLPSLKMPLSDDTKNFVTEKLLLNREDEAVRYPSAVGNVVNSALSVCARELSIFVGVSTEIVLIPVFCNKLHWSTIMIDLNYEEVVVYDPMPSTYAVGVRALAERLVTLLLEFAQRSFRVRPCANDLGVQVDTYNCGVYVLLPFEIFAGADQISMLNKKELQYLRYMYLCLCN
ncbi:hypothetical protein PHMEG_00011334 [Phytophthora megakarya]|uniref:Ubiquitin-like protease family profile domain-containing protein n=1 Tax=Phytophthora megakarya TaxID=4795 RepID=A0A225WBG6_9STRA|nr:hypothetical protein PHMEG_00011334 [Phytophthora megakarya]